MRDVPAALPRHGRLDLDKNDVAATTSCWTAFQQFRIFAPVGEPDEVVIPERQLVYAHCSGRRFFERTVAMNDAGASFLNTLAR